MSSVLGGDGVVMPSSRGQGWRGGRAWPDDSRHTGGSPWLGSTGNSRARVVVHKPAHKSHGCIDYGTSAPQGAHCVQKSMPQSHTRSIHAGLMSWRQCSERPRTWEAPAVEKHLPSFPYLSLSPSKWGSMKHIQLKDKILSLVVALHPLI